MRAESFLYVSAAASLTAALTKFRNLSSDQRLNEEYVFRRALAEPLYLMIGVIALVEAVVRPLIAALLFLPTLALGIIVDESNLGNVVCFGFRGGVVGIDTAIRCLVALVKNVYERRIRYNDLSCCQIQVCE